MSVGDPLQLLDRDFRRGPIEVLDEYVLYARSLLAHRPLPDLFQAAGCKFDFSAKTVKPLIELIRQELRKLKQTPEKLSAAA